MNILGVNMFLSDSAAALVCNGDIIAAVQEERLSRVKGDVSFPEQSIKYCLAAAGLSPKDIDAVAVVAASIPQVKPAITYDFENLGFRSPDIVRFADVSRAHTAAAFFPSPFDRAAILVLDSVTDYAPSVIARGTGNSLEILEQYEFPHSLGILYSTFTQYAGFKINSGEYKVMGLAPYGEPVYTDLIYDNLVEIDDDGMISLNESYFNLKDIRYRVNDAFISLFGQPPRKPESEITQHTANIARSIQQVAEDCMLRAANHTYKISGESNLCLAGYMALNCVAAGRIMRESPFSNVWIQPAAGYAGCAIGAALHSWHTTHAQPRHPDGLHDTMKAALLGPEFSDDDIALFLEEHDYPARKLDGHERAAVIAELTVHHNVIGILQGRMEFGPRALGNRTIIGDPRSPEMQSVMNRKIKFRESFRPFAPSCLEERVEDYFELDRPSPYMLIVTHVTQKRRVMNSINHGLPLRERINEARSDIPAVTHADYSARVQTVSQTDNPAFYSMIKEFERHTGCAVLINTSFNVRGEPIVCTPEDAYRCFMRTDMDYLLLESYLLDKKEQPEWHEADSWRDDHVLD
jgi:carbamoyltransferase